MAWLKTSDESIAYNCVAWALGFNHIAIWPDAAFDLEWPFPKPEVGNVDDFGQLFALFGYERCATEIYEVGYEKIALYAPTEDAPPEHAARQLPDGRWASKLGGRGIDGEHDHLADWPQESPYREACRTYGGARYFFRRRRGGKYPSYEEATASKSSPSEPPPSVGRITAGGVILPFGVALPQRTESAPITRSDD